MKINVIITDDHKLFREGLVSLLSKSDDINIMAVAENGEELESMLTSKNPDVVLIDITMPGISGLDIIKEGKEKFPMIKFIVLTMHAEGQYVVKAVKNGAYGYLLKNSDEKELLTAIRDVAVGKKYFNSDISQLMIGNMSMESDHLKKLSERELEVLRLVSDGRTTKEIAEALFVSSRTVESHRVNMMKKLKVQNTAELIKKAAHMKLI